MCNTINAILFGHSFQSTGIHCPTGSTGHSLVGPVLCGTVYCLVSVLEQITEDITTKPMQDNCYTR